MNLESPVVVLGDASSSMQVAINTSSIITLLLCSLADAELHLFKDEDIPVEKPPRSVADAVSFAKKMTASNSTSPAASLLPYYKAKKVIKTFIIVTDEEENTDYAGNTVWESIQEGEKMFAKLYKRYCSEIHPAQLIFISFTEPNRDGEMITALKKVIGDSTVSEFVHVYKFDKRNPDLTKLDYVLEKLAKPVEEKGEKAKGWFSSWFLSNSNV